jgi:hypothetical protein
LRNRATLTQAASKTPVAAIAIGVFHSPEQASKLRNSPEICGINGDKAKNLTSFWISAIIRDSIFTKFS